jgi:hypothetical protein
LRRAGGAAARFPRTPAEAEWFGGAAFPAQRRQRHLNDGIVDIGDLDHRTPWVDHALPDDGVDLDRHVVARDGFLLLDNGGLGSEVQGGLPLDERPQEIQTRARRPTVFAQTKDHGSLILGGDPQR